MSEIIYNFIKKASEAQRKNEEEFLVDLLITTKTSGTEDLLLSLIDYHLKEGDKEEGKGNLIEAGEHYWSSLSYALKLVALRENLEISDYPSYYSFVEYLSYKTQDPSMIIDFVNAEKLHGEYHPRPQGEGFNIRRDHAIALIRKIKENILIKPK